MHREKRAFYRWAAMQMEPWDGPGTVDTLIRRFSILPFLPALLAFSDGRYVGAILDRNGLRPARFCITADDHLYLSSEVGVNDLPVETIVKKVITNACMGN